MSGTDSLTAFLELYKGIFNDSRRYYLKSQEEVENSTLFDVEKKLHTLAQLIPESEKEWNLYWEKRYLRIMTLEEFKESIEYKLLKKGELDFGQLNNIILRLNTIDIIIPMINIMYLYVSSYKEICNKRSLSEQVKTSESFLFLLNRYKEEKENESLRYTNQIQRYSLYYQNKMTTLSFTLSIGALFIAVLSILVALFFK